MPPTASFSVDVEVGSAPFIVNFSNDSEGPTDSAKWDFGDGTSSVEMAPSHRYTLAGTHMVRLTVAGPGGSDTNVRPVIVNPGPVANLVISPSIAAVAADKATFFRAVPQDEFGNSVVESVSWSSSGEGGSIDPDGLFNAGPLIGEFIDTVTATLQLESGELTATASVTVSPGPLATVAVVPGEIGLEIGSTHKFTFVAKDEFGNEITDALSSWSVSPGVGEVDSGGVITAGSTAGFYVDGVRVEIVRQTERAAGTADVTVSPDSLASIIVAPLQASINQGKSQSFTATGFDQYDNAISGLAFLWESSGGRISQTGFYTAIQPFGLHTVTASASFKDSRRSGTATVQAGGRPGGNIRMSAYADVQSWDPVGSLSLSSVQAYSQLYNQLVQFSTAATDQVVCDLCESWEVTDGGKTYRFKLREGIKWIDGNDLTAEDVVFSMERYMRSGAVGRSGLFRNYLLSADAGGVRLINSRTLEFQLQFSSTAFLKFLALDYTKVLPKHLLEIGVDLFDPQVVIAAKSGSGPFVLDEYQRGNFYKVSKNPDYFKSGRPFFDSIDHFIITDTGTLIASLRAGQIDLSNGGFTNLTTAQSRALENDTNGRIKAVPVSPSADWGLMLNVKKAPFNNPKVREAIQLAIDYQKWNDQVFDGTSGIGCPLMGLAHTFEECSQWPGLRPKNGPGGAEDVARAKQLMADAGFANGFTTKYAVRQVGTYPDQCAVIKETLKNTLGIVGEMTIYPSAAGYNLFGTSRASGSEGDWEMACQGEGQVVLDVDGIMGGVYLKGATRNYTDWSNSQVDAWHQLQKIETDPARRREIQKEMELFLFTQQDNHWITLGWGVLWWIISEDIRGFNAPQTVQTHFKHEDLWIDR